MVKSSSNFNRLASRRNSNCRPSLLCVITERCKSRRACKDSTLAGTGNLLWSPVCGGESVTPAKAIFIFVCPFVTLAQDCAVSFNPRQLQKGDGLCKNGRLRDLFGVAEGALSGQELLQTLPDLSRSTGSL